MKSLGNNLEEFKKNCPSKELYKDIEAICRSENEVSEIDMEDSFAMGQDFSADFGGVFFLVEDHDDLDKISTATFDEQLNRYRTLLETGDEFDVCEYTKDGLFVQVLLITNNAGGHTYLIPKEIAQNSPTVLESILMTQTAC
jgi:hypothetical protein